MYFSIIVPVYNRPEEIKAFLDSVVAQKFHDKFEVLIIEDGSNINCKEIVESFSQKINVKYFHKNNSGPGDSRNFGMKHAKGNYFLIFDSDCVLPKQYIEIVDDALKINFVDCFGGPDGALDSFSDIQKAINFAMTSFLTTGGVRGGSEQLDKFQPRSFNMGMSKDAFIASNGFGNIHPGEDPDLSMRLWDLGFKTKLFKSAFVYHNRRINWTKFYQQVNKFGLVRPILDNWHPKHKKIVFFFPTLFILLLFFGLVLLFFNIIWPIYFFLAYFSLVFLTATIIYGNVLVGIMSSFAVGIQFFGYGFGYLKSFFILNILRKEPRQAFSQLFFKNNEN